MCLHFTNHEFCTVQYCLSHFIIKIVALINILTRCTFTKVISLKVYSMYKLLLMNSCISLLPIVLAISRSSHRHSSIAFSLWLTGSFPIFATSVLFLLPWTCNSTYKCTNNHFSLSLTMLVRYYVHDQKNVKITL